MSRTHKNKNLNKTTILIAASALALVGLVLFQVSWYKHSIGLLEEQFNSTVNMAMCLAIQNAGPEESAEVSPTVVDSNSVFYSCSPAPLNLAKLDTALAHALAFYNIPLDYEFRILEPDEQTGCGTGHCCSLTPFVETNKQSLQVFFPGKTPYLMGKMKYQLGACLLIILFITGVFVMANYLFVQQKRIAQSNVDFFNNMAHEFNTPLTNIGLATKLFAKTGTTHQNERYLNIIKNESGKLHQQVERFLQLMKMENGSFQLQMESVNLNELLQKVIEDMQLQVAQQNGHLQLHADTSDVFVEADPFHLGNAFRNLIDNAIKYAIDRPRIDIYLKQDQHNVSILFEDAGTGISQNEQKHIFKKFHRTPNGDIHTQKGFGLGLAYVKSIVEAHQGAIRVFSELNKGSRFDLHLPVKS